MPTQRLRIGPSRLVTFTTDNDGVSPDHIELMSLHCPQLGMLTSHAAQFMDRTFVADDPRKDWPRKGLLTSVIDLTHIPWSILKPVQIRDEDQTIRDTDLDPPFTDMVTLLYVVTHDRGYNELDSGRSLLYGVRAYSQNPDLIACVVVVTVVRGPEIDKREVRIQTLLTDNGVIQAWRTVGRQQALADFGKSPEEE